MIPRTIPTWQVKSWQEELAQLITEPQQLFALLGLDRSLLPAAERAQRLFPLRATRSYVNRIRKGDPHDPLLRQILPLGEELASAPGFAADPLDEEKFTKAPGLIHKYRGRVLLVAARQCAINCRYCFRRHHDYQHNSLSRGQWREALQYLQAHRDVEEVILSGGDPLALSDRQLGRLVGHIRSISHIKRLRIHTRLPIVAPMRINDELLAMLGAEDLQTVVVIHCNHARELDGEVAHQLQKMRARMSVLNQTVLLRGVNDDAKTLSELSTSLFSCGVLPYYLHMLDKVAGSAHFEIDETRARSLYQALLATLPGYLVPRLVKEVPGAPSKVPVV